jgi:excisionase family DNA binding protein
VAAAVTELKVTESGREDARKSASLLARAALRMPAGLFLKKATGEPVTLELSGELLTLLQTILDRIAKTGDLLLLNQEAELTPEQAGKILGVSRPVVYHRMDSGRLPYRAVGTHRRVRLDDVLKLREFERQRRENSSALSADTDDLEMNYAAPSQMKNPRRRRGFSERPA